MNTLNVFGREYAPLYFEREWVASEGDYVRLVELFYHDGEYKRAWAILEDATKLFLDATPEEAIELERALVMKEKSGVSMSCPCCGFS